ncbi:uncharacterized protein N7496_012015 [Penicillium cataractarum]|uniref:Uncharacterized protein n=1 Tax=Penicillium cataractarum TaxID=2100454 RepID=A0A9W9RG09_9EURO|nr:uncharacterized protein N7496_012015 [Penicillium cataractarum]KAJ5359602.1 hypothetical protein N7496_012015 [Penicillium cataractarum]
MEYATVTSTVISTMTTTIVREISPSPSSSSPSAPTSSNAPSGYILWKKVKKFKAKEREQYPLLDRNPASQPVPVVEGLPCRRKTKPPLCLPVFKRVATKASTWTTAGRNIGYIVKA